MHAMAELEHYFRYDEFRASRGLQQRWNKKRSPEEAFFRGPQLSVPKFSFREFSKDLSKLGSDNRLFSHSREPTLEALTNRLRTPDFSFERSFMLNQRQGEECQGVAGADHRLHSTQRWKT